MLKIKSQTAIVTTMTVTKTTKQMTVQLVVVALLISLVLISNSASAALTYEAAYNETLEICKLTPAITPDYSSLNLADTTPLRTEKPIREGYNDAVRTGDYKQPSLWLRELVDNKGFADALEKCYPSIDTISGKPYSQMQLDFVSKLYKLDALGRSYAYAFTSGISIKNIESVQEQAKKIQEQISATLKKFSPGND